MPESRLKQEKSSRQTEPLPVLCIKPNTMLIAGLENLLAGAGYRLKVKKAEWPIDLQRKDLLKGFRLLISCCEMNDTFYITDLPEVRKQFPELKLMAIIRHRNHLLISELLKRGFEYIISERMKRDAYKDLAQAITRNEPYLDAECKAAIADHAFDLYTQSGTLHTTEMDEKILGYFDAGLKKQAIAELLCCSVKTIEYHLYKMYKEANVNKLHLLLRVWKREQ